MPVVTERRQYVEMKHARVTLRPQTGNSGCPLKPRGETGLLFINCKPAKPMLRFRGHPLKRRRVFVDLSPGDASRLSKRVSPLLGQAAISIDSAVLGSRNRSVRRCGRCAPMHASAHSHSFPNPSRHQRKKPDRCSSRGFWGFASLWG